MRAHTEKDFDTFERHDDYIICPSGDYSQVKKFPERCSFGEGCSFGGRCRFGKGCSFEAKRVTTSGTNPYFAVDRIGSEFRKAYFFLSDDGQIYIRAGCFFGTEDEFLRKLHADKDPHKTRTYEAALALAHMQLGV